jgi:hypothetical protein
VSLRVQLSEGSAQYKARYRYFNFQSSDFVSALVMQSVMQNKRCKYTDKKKARSLRTRLQHSIFGNCEGWKLIVAKIPPNKALNIGCSLNATSSYTQLIH